MNTIGIRREDKSRWEARAPLVPRHVRQLVRDHALDFAVQRSRRRAFADDDYSAAGAAVVETLDDYPIIMGVKEIPPENIERQRTYLYFSHTIKGQEANMPALARLLDQGCTLIDYERIVDEAGQRLVCFGRFAGLAGMVDTFWALGLRLTHEGVSHPFDDLKPCHEYTDLADVRQAFADVAARIGRDGLPHELAPFVVGFLGYGRVSRGAQEILDLLPCETVRAEDLAGLSGERDRCFKVVFEKPHLVQRRDEPGAFDRSEYAAHPERYESAFERYLAHLTVLVNGVYWEPGYPALVTREHFQRLYGAGRPPRLRVIGDITCDIDGSVACTVRSTTPDNPIYVYDPATAEGHDGVVGNGPVVLAVDFLPCELPVDASVAFSNALRPFIPALASADFSRPLEDSGLPIELQRATVTYRGQLTADYGHLEQYVNGAE